MDTLTRLQQRCNPALHKSLNMEDTRSLSPLWEAVISGDVKVVRQLLKTGADANEPHPWREDSFTPLKELAYHRGQDMEVALLLVKHGADVNAGGEESPLYLAVQNGNVKLAQLLLEHDARVEEPVVLLSMALGSFEITKEMIILLGNYTDLNVTDIHGNNALHWLSESKLENTIEIAEVLLVSGVSLEQCGYQSYTPLLHAVWMNKPTLVSLFLRHGANIHQTTITGETALHLACMYHRENIIRLLLENGADVNALDIRGVTPFSFMRLEVLPSIEVMTEHLAKLHVNKDVVRKDNLILIQKYPNLHKFYKDCLNNFSETRKIKYYLYLAMYIICLLVFIFVGCIIIDTAYGTEYIYTYFFVAVHRLLKNFKL